MLLPTFLVTIMVVFCAGSNEIFLDHDYYTMSVYQNKTVFAQHFVDMSQSQIHKTLSNKSIGAETLYFTFPFYGHVLTKFYVTTHGFLSFSTKLHTYFYLNQYIAPLKLKLDPGKFDDSLIKYDINEKSATIQWTNLTIHGNPNSGKFTFQTTLHQSGDIVFVYLNVHDIHSPNALLEEDVLAGISDSFQSSGYLYKYHQMVVPSDKIQDQTVVVFKPKPTCNIQYSCDACTLLRKKSDFDCSWCPVAEKCSDGADRLREHWDKSGCARLNVTNINQCQSSPSSRTNKHSSASSHAIVIASVSIVGLSVAIVGLYLAKKFYSKRPLHYHFIALNEANANNHDLES